MNAARIHFETLPLEAKRDAMTRLSLAGNSDYAIAAATGLSVEYVRAVLREREARVVG